MEREKIEEILGRSVRKVLPRANEITLDSRFREDLGADSLDMTSLIMEIEDEFHIAVKDEAARLVLTIRDAVSMISQTFLSTPNPNNSELQATATEITSA